MRLNASPQPSSGTTTRTTAGAAVCAAPKHVDKDDVLDFGCNGDRQRNAGRLLAGGGVYAPQLHCTAAVVSRHTRDTSTYIAFVVVLMSCALNAAPTPFVTETTRLLPLIDKK